MFLELLIRFTFKGGKIVMKNILDLLKDVLYVICQVGAMLAEVIYDCLGDYIKRNTYSFMTFAIGLIVIACLISYSLSMFAEGLHMLGL